MASDRKQYEHARMNWQKLYEEGAFSVPENLGKAAIFCAHVNPDPNDDKQEFIEERREQKVFRKEAFAYQRQLGSIGIDSELIYHPSFNDFTGVLEDPKFHSVITIGNGSLSDYTLSKEILPRGLGEDAIDWRDVAAYANHLKLGNFIQRHCGHFSRSLNIPLGMFAVANHELLSAPVGNMIEPNSFRHPHNDFMTPVMSKQESLPPYKEIKLMFGSC